MSILICHNTILTRKTIMKSLIKIAMASFLVLSSAQLKATEVDIDVTEILSQSISEYLEQTSREFQKSLKEAVYIDTKAISAELFLNPTTKQSTLIIDSNHTEKAAQ